MTTRIIPWYLPKDYDAIKRLMKDDPNIPNAYNEWLKIATDQVANFEAQGFVPDKVVIHPNELTSFCESEGLNYDCISAGRLAHRKSANQK